MNLTNLYQQRYDKALADKEKLHQVSCVTIPVLLLTLLALFIYARPGPQVIGSFLTIFILTINAVLTILPVEKLDYFPKVMVGDLVIYNPKDKNGELAYKVSKEHPLLNELIPKWEVISVGQTSLVIKHGTTMKELEFTRHKDLIPQPKPAQVEFKQSSVRDLIESPALSDSTFEREDIL